MDHNKHQNTSYKGANSSLFHVLSNQLLTDHSIIRRHKLWSLKHVVQQRTGLHHFQESRIFSLEHVLQIWRVLIISIYVFSFAVCYWMHFFLLPLPSL